MRERVTALRDWMLAPDADPAPRHQAIGLAALRILLGLMWLYNVAWKRPPDFGQEDGNGLYKFTSYAVDHPVFPPYSWIVERLVLPSFEIFGWTVLLAETTLAVLLLSGTFVRVAALLGIAQSLAIGLSVAYAPDEWPWSYWLMIGAHVAVLVGSSGRFLAVDGARAGVVPAALQQRVWGVVAVVVGLFSVVASAGDPLDATGPGLRSTDLSMSLGSFNLLGGLVVLVVGFALLAGVRGLLVAGAGLAVAAAVLLTVQIGFADPLLGGSATSAALLLTLAVIAAAPAARRSSTGSRP